MNISKLKLFVFVVIFVSFSCKKQQEKTQMQNVIAIHDELMPKMSTIGSLITQLNTADSINYRTAVKDLETSHDAMMTWMQDFGKDFDTDEVMNGKLLSEEKEKRLDIQEQKVNTLKEQMNLSIQNAKSILTKIKNQQ